MNDEEAEITERAIAFAKANKRAIAKEYTDTSNFPPDKFPISVFMAGSPGAGKTESSRNLIKNITAGEQAVIRIDSDDLRPMIKEYNGENSSLLWRRLPYWRKRSRTWHLKTGKASFSTVPFRILTRHGKM